MCVCDMGAEGVENSSLFFLRHSIMEQVFVCVSTKSFEKKKRRREREREKKRTSNYFEFCTTFLLYQIGWNEWMKRKVVETRVKWCATCRRGGGGGDCYFWGEGEWMQNAILLGPVILPCRSMWFARNLSFSTINRSFSLGRWKRREEGGN